MHSIRTKITVLMLAAIFISVSLFGGIGVFTILTDANRLSAGKLNLICENRRETVDESLIGVEDAVNMMANFAIDSIDVSELEKGGVLGAKGDTPEEVPGRSNEQKKELDQYFDRHLDKIESAFKIVSNYTDAVSICYYRINPQITSTEKGFYYSKTGDNEYSSLKLTKLENYDPDDLSHVGWYYIPIEKGEPTWLDPYYTANPGGMVMSYAFPVVKEGTCIGVLGMDINLDVIVRQIEDFPEFKTGFFVLADKEGMAYYHPDFKIEYEPINVNPDLISRIKGMKNESSSNDIISYDKNGHKWQLAYSTLENGLKLAAIVKQSEINASSYKLACTFAVIGILLLLLFAFITVMSLRKLTASLKNLSDAAKGVSKGNYDIELEYKGNDEVGILTEGFSAMRDRLKVSFAELSASKEKLQDALTVASHADAAKTSFLNKMSHEARTPLNAIIGFTYLAEENLDDREKLNDYIHKIQISGKHMLSLINGILDVSRLESEDEVLSEEEFSLKDMFSQINSVYEPKCINKDQVYSFRIIGELYDIYIGDAVRLKEVLTNIIDNAVKFTPSGGMIHVSAEQISVHDNMSTLRFVVQDNGIGISDEHLPKIFDPFFQADEGYANQAGSIGLGLSVTKGIVQLMDGEISVESKEGEGSVFTVILTLKTRGEDAFTDSSLMSEPENENKQEAALEGLRVLIVEDMPINAEMLKGILNMKGIETEWAENGQIAVDMFSGSGENYYDAILMDIRMPVMDGLQATKNIRKLERPDAKTVPIVAMTANAFPEDIKSSMQSGMNEHLSKPLDTERLFEVMGKIAAHQPFC